MRKYRFIVMLVIAVLGYFFKDKLPQSSSKQRPSSSNQGQVEEYVSLKGCQYVPHRGNDGDSFHVRDQAGKEYEIRLYFVDAPESSFKTYRDGNNNGKRIAHQGRDLGQLSQDETTQLGKEAKKWVNSQLKKGTFEVVTKWEPVFQSGRYFAFVKVGGEDQWLHEQIVARGLGRIYTQGTRTPDGRSVSQQKKILYQLEKKAKLAKLGAWAQ